MKKNLLKTLFVAIALVMGAGSASALTTDLSFENTVIAGYKNIVLYDFTSNGDNIMPVEGDLRYREGWGLFNFASGNRGCDITLPTALNAGDLLVIDFRDTQAKNSTVNSISNCSSVSAKDNTHKFYEVTESASTFNVNIGRAGCIVAILVIQEDPDASTVNYTVNYVCGNTTLKTESLVGVDGGDPLISKDPIYIEGVKYVYESDDATGQTVSSGSSFTVSFREAALYTLNVYDDQSEFIGTAKAYEGDNASVPFRRYQIRNGWLWEKTAYNNVYKFSATMTEDRNETITYTTTDKDNVICLLEGEDIPGLTASNGGTIDVRASNAYGGYNASEEDVVLCSVGSGNYKLTVHTVGNADTSENWIKAGGENVLNATFTGNFGIVSAEFSVAQTCNLTIGKFGGSQKVIDLLYIQSSDGSVATAIQGVKNVEVANEVIYNLAGQEVKNAKKGIFIQNGKKVVR